jgi:hypothetical protein
MHEGLDLCAHPSSLSFSLFHMYTMSLNASSCFSLRRYSTSCNRASKAVCGHPPPHTHTHTRIHTHSHSQATKPLICKAERFGIQARNSPACPRSREIALLRQHFPVAANYNVHEHTKHQVRWIERDWLQNGELVDLCTGRGATVLLHTGTTSYATASSRLCRAWCLYASNDACTWHDVAGQ